MKQRLEAMKAEALSRLAEASDPGRLNELRVHYLGKKGQLTEILRGMGSLPPEERPEIGRIANEVRAALEAVIADKQALFEREETAARLRAETIDVTLPGRAPQQGAVHPLMKVQQEIEDIFLGMGYTIAEGPEVETDFFNFEALNIPKNHPARDMQDTFYITDEILLRTHTSPVQIRAMRAAGGRTPLKGSSSARTSG